MKINIIFKKSQFETIILVDKITFYFENNNENSLHKKI